MKRAVAVALAHFVLVGAACEGPIAPEHRDRSTVSDAAEAPRDEAKRARTATRRLWAPYPCQDLGPRRPDTTRVELWFYDTYSFERSKYARAVVVHRDIRSTPSIAAASVEAWIGGPTRQERKLGVFRIANRDTELLGINVEDGAATVDVSEEFHETGLGTCCEGLVLMDLVGTLTQFPGIERVLLWTEGEPARYFGGHGGILERDGETRPRRGYRVVRPCA